VFVHGLLAVLQGIFRLFFWETAGKKQRFLRQALENRSNHKLLNFMIKNV